jgi:hypothetical protein
VHDGFVDEVLRAAFEDGGSGISAGVIAGIVIGALAAIAIAIALAWFFLWRPRKKGQEETEVPKERTETPPVTLPSTDTAEVQTTLFELDSMKHESEVAMARPDSLRRVIT